MPSMTPEYAEVHKRYGEALKELDRLFSEYKTFLFNGPGQVGLDAWAYTKKLLGDNRVYLNSLESEMFELAKNGRAFVDEI